MLKNDVDIEQFILIVQYQHFFNIYYKYFQKITFSAILINEIIKKKYIIICILLV